MGGGASKARLLTEKQIQKYVKDTVWRAACRARGAGAGGSMLHRVCPVRSAQPRPRRHPCACPCMPLSHPLPALVSPICCYPPVFAPNLVPKLASNARTLLGLASHPTGQWTKENDAMALILARLQGFAPSELEFLFKRFRFLCKRGVNLSRADIQSNPNLANNQYVTRVFSVMPKNEVGDVTFDVFVRTAGIPNRAPSRGDTAS